MIRKMTVFMVLFALPMLAWSHTCPAYIEMIDESLDQMEVDADTEAEVSELRDEGEALHEDGDHEGAIDKLDQALALLEGQQGGY